MDLYGDDIDSLLGIDQLNQNINADENNEDIGTSTDGGGAMNYDNENEDKNDSNDDESNKPTQPIEPKKRTVRNPQLRLNVERLKSERGIQAIDEYFTDIKFHGKGHEKHDLNNVLKRLEHWAHRLYPKYNFDDFIETTEKLGKKKQIQTYMNMYRQGLLEKVNVQIENDDKDDEMNENDDGIVAPREPIDEFDDLIGQQIEKYRTLPPRTPAHETTFDSIRSPNSSSRSSVLLATPSFSSRAAVASTPMSDIYPLPQSPMPAATDSSSTSTTITSEQMAKIAENRRIAQERLRAKREAAAAAAAAAATSSEAGLT